MTGSHAGAVFVLACLAAVAWTIRRLRNQAAEDQCDPSPAHPAARAVSRALPRQGRPVDGDCLSRDEWGQFVGILFASWRHVDEPEYKAGAR